MIINYSESPSKQAMINKLNLLSNHKKAESISIRVIVNSFTGNPSEVAQSEEILNYFKVKKVKVTEVIDINQEIIFDKEKSKK